MADSNLLNVEVITAVGAVVLDPNKGVSIISGATASLCTLANADFVGQEKTIVFTTDTVAHTVTPATFAGSAQTVITSTSTTLGIGSVKLIYAGDTVGWTIVGRSSTGDAAAGDNVLLNPTVA